MAMPPMIGYSIRSSLFTNNVPTVAIGAGRDKTFLAPAQPKEDSYWICFISAKNPPMKKKNVIDIRYRSAIRLWSVVNSHEPTP